MDRETPEPQEAIASTGLLSFYDRLRSRITWQLEKRGGTVGRKSADLLLLAPDIFILLVRLSLDRTVPKATRRMLVGALAYFMMPMDALPEAVLGVGGFLDDVVLASLVLAQAFGEDLEPYAARYWNGPDKLRVVLRDISQTARSLLGRNLFGRLERMMGKRGIKVHREI